MAEPADAEQLADRAVGAVGRDHIASAHGSLGPAVARPGGDRHAVVVAVHDHGLGGVLDLHTEPLRGAGEHGLEPDLGDEEPRRRADVLDALVDEAEVPVQLLAAEALDGQDRAVLDELRCGRLLDLLLQADRAIRLDVRWFTSAARGWIAVPRWRSSTRDGTPRWPRKTAADSPTRLPPTITTGTSSFATSGRV